MNFESLEDRLENWSRTVRSPRFQSGVCAQWARWYVSIRNSESSRYEPVEVVITKDELDGWKVESAWSSMTNPTLKHVLKLHYIWRMAPDQIQTRLRKQHGINLRGRNMDLVIADANRSISKILAEREAGEILRNVAGKVAIPKSLLYDMR